MGEKHQGYVADYCAICRDIAPMALLSSFQQGRWIHITNCTGCSIRYAADPTHYKNFEPKLLPIIDLIAKTNPLLPRNAIERAAYDNAAVRGLLTPEFRSQAFREPFQLIAYRWDTITSRAPSWLVGVLIGIVPAFAAYVIIDSHKYTIARTVPVALVHAAALILILGACFAAGLWHHRRHTRRMINEPLQILARALRPLRPTLDEIKDELRPLRATHSVPRWLTPERLHKAISALPDTSFSNLSFTEIEAMAHRQYEAQQSMLDRFEHGADTDPDDDSVTA